MRVPAEVVYVMTADLVLYVRPSVQHVQSSVFLLKCN